MHFEFLAILLGLSACAANDGTEYMSNAKPQCEISGDLKGEASGEQVCAMFMEAANSAGRDDIARVEIAMPSATHAIAAAYDEEGAEIARLDFDVVDAELRPAIWETFARDFGRYLASQK